MRQGNGEVSRPLLQYHGSKFRLAPWIISHFPPHRVYVEPYGGAGAVLLRKPPAEVEVWNDLNDDVVNLFCVLRDREKAAELERLLRLTPYARSEWLLAYEPCNDLVERARRLIVRSYMSIGNDAGPSCRKSGFRAYSNIGLVGTAPVQSWRGFVDALPAFVERLSGRVIIENRDALGLIEYHDASHTLFYCDPPYPKSTRQDGGDDYAYEMNDDDHRVLAGVLKSVEGMVALSGYPCALYDEELFSDWRRVEREAITGSAGKGAKVRKTEVLWMNFDEPIIAEPVPAIQQLTLESLFA